MRRGRETSIQGVVIPGPAREESGRVAGKSRTETKWDGSSRRKEPIRSASQEDSQQFWGEDKVDHLLIAGDRTQIKHFSRHFFADVPRPDVVRSSVCDSLERITEHEDLTGTSHRGPRQFPTIHGPWGRPGAVPQKQTRFKRRTVLSQHPARVCSIAPFEGASRASPADRLGVRNCQIKAAQEFDPEFSAGALSSSGGGGPASGAGRATSNLPSRVPTCRAGSVAGARTRHSFPAASGIRRTLADWSRSEARREWNRTHVAGAPRPVRWMIGERVASVFAAYAG